MIQVLALDRPPPSVQSLLVEVAEIAVRRAGERGPIWVTVVDTPQTLDLLRLAQGQLLLGERAAPPGTYTQVRFVITQATVTIGGAARPVTIPTKQLRLLRPFRVNEGETTIVLLDFDGPRSLRVSEKGDYVLAPRIHVFLQPSKQDRGR